MHSLPTRAPYPSLDSAFAEAYFTRGLAKAHAPTYLLNCGAATCLNGAFLAMIKNAKHYKNCPDNADTQLSHER
jgi:hypothetical protein